MSSTFPPADGAPPPEPSSHLGVGPSPDVPSPFTSLEPSAGQYFDAASDPAGAVIRREGPSQVAEAPMPSGVYRRRVWLPIALFLLTCVSTFFVGATRWMPTEYLGACFVGMNAYDPLNFSFDATPLRRVLYSHWDDGLIYMACVIGILLMHEMGHFVMTLVYRVRASFPYFIPLPISPIGTVGAVIAMDGRKANRKEIFDIGLAGPLAGLVVAIPVLVWGTARLNFEEPPAGGLTVGLPLIVKLLLGYWQTAGYDPELGVAMSQANPFFMAGWVGLLVTGLNMMPVSQLDGGHVTYALLGRWAHWVARIFMLVVFVYMAFFNFSWVVMVVLVMLMGTDHPPTSDDTVPIGPWRTVLGWLSLLIPVFCFAPRAILLM